MPIYQISENNSGGYYRHKDKFDRLLVRADSEADALAKMEEAFDIDVAYENNYASCECCGPRFFSPWEVDEDELNEYRNDPEYTLLGIESKASSIDSKVSAEWNLYIGGQGNFDVDLENIRDRIATFEYIAATATRQGYEVEINNRFSGEDITLVATGAPLEMMGLLHYLIHRNIEPYIITVGNEREREVFQSTFEGIDVEVI